MRFASRSKDDGMQAADGAVVTYSRLRGEPAEPHVEPPHGPQFTAVEVPLVQPASGRRDGIDSVVPESAVPHDNDDVATPRRKRGAVGRVELSPPLLTLSDLTPRWPEKKPPS